MVRLLALQRVRKLQEQAAVSDNPVARLEAAGDLRLSFLAFAESDRTHSELIRRQLGVNERLIFAVAQNRGIGHGDRILDRSRLDRRGHVHVFLQLFTRIVGLYAGLQSPRSGIEGSCNVGDAPLKHIGISVRLDGDGISGSYEGQDLSDTR